MARSIHHRPLGAGVVAAVLCVLAVAGCSSGGPASSGGSGGQVTAGSSAQVPAALVGRWNGGSNRSGHWWYEFSRNATYRAWPERNPTDLLITGTFTVRGGVLTLSNNGAPVSYRASIQGGLLYLDGYSYVRA